MKATQPSQPSEGMVKKAIISAECTPTEIPDSKNLPVVKKAAGKSVSDLANDITTRLGDAADKIC